MTTPHQHQPTFLWQGLLILLPVVVLAGFSLLALQRDRLLAEREAQQAAAISAQQLQRAVADVLADQLEAYREASLHFANLRNATLELMLYAPSSEAPQAERASLQTWQTRNPEFDLNVWPGCHSEIVASDAAALAQHTKPPPVPDVPQPPTWLGALTSEQSKLWAQVEASEDAPACAQMLKQLYASRAGEAWLNAQLHLLELETGAMTPAQAFERWRTADAAFSPALTSAGLPVGQVACLRALRRREDGGGFPESGKQWIAHAALNSPSLLTPLLIAEVRRVAPTNQADFVMALEGRWRSDELTRHIREALRAEQELDATTNLWRWVNVENEGDWLVTQHCTGSGAVTGNNVEQRADLFHLQILPAALVAKIIRDTTAQSGVWLPPYALATIQLGERNVGASSGSLQPRAQLAYPLLAESAAGAVRMRAPVLEYPLAVQMHLARPEQLLAQHRQRTLLTGALLLGVALVAAVGLFAAWRSFQKQLRLNEMKSNFVSSVSHELRAPIASVRLLAESLERGKISEPAKQNEYFRFIGQECRRLSALIENVLDFSRIEQGRKQYEFEPTDLSALVEQTVKLMQPYAEERGVRLQSEVRSQRSEIELDGRAIQQALVNLIDNAIKHSPKDAVVTVTLETRNTQCGVRSGDAGTCNLQPSTFNLSVSDSGPGIPASEHEKIFKRFYRLGSELRRETQGVGIGLSIVKHVVEAHSGRVRVESEVGKGSRFTIELPIMKSEGRNPRSE
jgi:signal transduction histidine kinase